MLTYIDVNKINPHPDNPRKDLGDLTELAESIKINGILQNLTVVPWFSEITRAPADNGKMDGYYRAVIGHRRLAAAKLAGLTQVPCVITDMGHKEQIATMLLENIQRSDLTVLEQADGFQMMLDLGETVAGIAQQTGFSETTIRHRVRLTELKRDKLEAAVVRGGTIQDYIALEQIKDSKLKHKALDAIGTNNYKWQLEQALEEEARVVRKKKMLAFFEGWATPVKDHPNGTTHVRYFHGFKLDDFKKPKDAGKIEYYYNVDNYGVALYKTAEVPEKKEKTEAEKSYRKREAELKKLSKRAYELRYAFVKEFSAAKKYFSEIYALVFRRLTQYSHADLNNILKLLDIAKPEGEDYKSEVQDAKRGLIFERYIEHPEKTMLLVAYACFDDKPSNGYFSAFDWQLKIEHKKNEHLDKVYDVLVVLGYKMSDEEHALRDGTHELFREGGPS